MLIDEEMTLYKKDIACSAITIFYFIFDNRGVRGKLRCTSTNICPFLPQSKCRKKQYLTKSLMWYDGILKQEHLIIHTHSFLNPNFISKRRLAYIQFKSKSWSTWPSSSTTQCIFGEDEVYVDLSLPLWVEMLFPIDPRHNNLTIKKWKRTEVKVSNRLSFYIEITS